MSQNHLRNVNGELYIQDVSALKIAEEHGTPLYVMSENKIRENYRRLAAVFRKHYGAVRILYSAKANTNLSVLRILESEGAEIDAVSIGEIFLALEAGFSPARILYTGTSVSDEELAYASEKGVIINLDSLSQAVKLLKIVVPTTLSVRVNTEIGAGHHEYTVTASKKSKFGVDEKTALKIYRMAKDAGVEKFGIHMHIGSGVMKVEPFIKSTEKLMEVAEKIHRQTDVSFNFVDIGGGLGVPYKPDEEPLDLENFADKLTQVFKKKLDEYALNQPELLIEPGRYLVAEAGILLAKVQMVKETLNRKFVGVDAGFNTLIRPAMYGAYHHILVANKLNEASTQKYDVVGPLCESGDVLARDRLLPQIDEGDILAILNAGAYGYSMSSQYNSRPRPAEVLVKNECVEVIRARETFQDLIRGQRVASWLKG